MQKYLEDPFDFCLAALAVSLLTGAEIFGRRNFYAVDILAEIIGNPDFLEGKC